MAIDAELLRAAQALAKREGTSKVMNLENPAELLLYFEKQAVFWKQKQMCKTLGVIRQAENCLFGTGA